MRNLITCFFLFSLYSIAVPAQSLQSGAADFYFDDEDYQKHHEYWRERREERRERHEARREERHEQRHEQRREERREFRGR